MTGDRAERFVVLNLRLLAATFAVVGILFIAMPDGVLEAITDFGDWLPLGSFSAAPETVEKFWLALGFAYMTVIAGLALVISLDVARYRPLLLVLAAGKAASSLSAGAFYLWDSHVFIYLANFVVDGSLVGVALGCWMLSARVLEARAPV